MYGLYAQPDFGQNRNYNQPSMDHRDTNRRGKSGPLFTRQQAAILVMVVFLGTAALGLAAVLLFSPHASVPAAPPALPETPTAQAFLTEKTTPPAAAPGETNLPACAQQSGGIQQGVVVRLVDSSTIEVKVNDAPLLVSYAGLSVPTEGPLSEQALQQARAVIEGQPVVLVRDPLGVDTSNHLARYVFSNGHFLNMELLQRGLARVDPGVHALSCASSFRQAEQQARDARLGLWKPAPIPTATFMPMVTLDTSNQAACNCSARPVCSDFRTHAEAQACFNKCNDYNSKLDDNHNGIACEGLP